MIRPVLPLAELPEAVAVTWFGPELGRLAEDMWETLYASEDHTLTAPQVGEALRLVTIDLRWREGTKEPVALINPEITDSAPALHILEATCLSDPGRRFRVGRPIWVDVAWTGLSGVRQSGRFHGAGAARVCQALALLDGRCLAVEGTEI